ncbi:MAG: hypothetical protein K2F67_05460 [Eubacterium sp.]|nr:hypothetical protein [Eubacterium sp.]MDE6768023.1 hypothetical protein [Eubacterium sp.]
MRIENVVDDIIDMIKADAYFSNIRVVKAYPCSTAPTHLANETVAIGIDEISFSSMSVDESSREGNIAVFMDIFVPIKMSSSRASDILSGLCRCFRDLNILSVCADRITVHVDTAAYLLRTVFTFNNEIEVV